MSRIGKKVIDVPKDVTVNLVDDKIIVKGKNGTLEKSIENILNLTIENQQVKELCY